ncbi:MAG: hypothetical protein JO142_20295 [Burkholderiales bacterium]|nr:hypothetical protein [Burkholderiales bacterium]
MNNAPKLNIQVRAGTAIIALFATFAVLHSVDAMSAHYVKQASATQMVASQQATCPKA